VSSVAVPSSSSITTTTITSTITMCKYNLLSLIFNLIYFNFVYFIGWKGNSSHHKDDG
jgi:hypothetical protein